MNKYKIMGAVALGGAAVIGGITLLRAVRSQGCRGVGACEGKFCGGEACGCDSDASCKSCVNSALHGSKCGNGGKGGGVAWQSEFADADYYDMSADSAEFADADSSEEERKKKIRDTVEEYWVAHDKCKGSDVALKAKVRAVPRIGFKFNSKTK